MEKSISSRFSSTNFMLAALALLNKEGIQFVNLKELAKKLSYYYMDEYYNELFDDFKLNQNLTLKMDEVFSILSSVGAISSECTGSGCFANFVSAENSEKALEKLNDIEQNFFTDMIHEIAITMNLQYEYNCEIIYDDPNKTYTLMKAVKGYNNQTIETQLFTDGNVTAVDGRPIVSPIMYCEDPINEEKIIKMKNIYEIDFEISDATYAIKRILGNNQVLFNKIFTKNVSNESITELLKLMNKLISKNISADTFPLVYTLKK